MGGSTPMRPSPHHPTEPLDATPPLGRGAIILDWLEHASYTLPPQQLRTPSYYPYNPLMQPRRLDYVATRGITPGEGKVHPCRDRAASDHDAVAIPVGKHKGGGPTRATWGPRRLRPPHQVQQLLAVPPPKGEDTRQVLSALAHAITVSGEHQTNSARATPSSRCAKQLKQPRQAQQPERHGRGWQDSGNESNEHGHNSRRPKQHNSTGELCDPSKPRTHTRAGTFTSETTPNGNSTWGTTCRPSSPNPDQAAGFSEWQPSGYSSGAGVKTHRGSPSPTQS